MPHITLNNRILSYKSATEINQLLQQMLDIISQNKEFNKQLWRKLSILLECIKSTENNAVRQREFLLQIYALVTPIIQCVHGTTIMFDPLSVVPTIIVAAKEDEKRAGFLQNFIASLLKLDTIDVSILATFHYTLTLELERLQVMEQNASNEQTMLINLIKILELLVLPEDISMQVPDLSKIYYFCKSLMIHTPMVDMKSMEVGIRGELLYDQEKLTKLDQAIERLIKLSPHAKPIENWELIHAILENVLRVDIDALPNCYSLNLENYSKYNFNAMYTMVDIYNTLRARYIQSKSAGKNPQQTKQTETATACSVIKEPQKPTLQQEEITQPVVISEAEQHEIEAFFAETERAIAESRALSLAKKAKRESAGNSSVSTKEKQPVLPQTQKIDPRKIWLDKLCLLSSDNIINLYTLYTTIANNKLTYADIEKIIQSKAVGGKLEINDGSKTKIHFFIDGRYKAFGNFHKPHKDTDKLNVEQCRKILNAFKAAGLTEEIMQEAYARIMHIQNQASTSGATAPPASGTPPATVAQERKNPGRKRKHKP